MTTLYNGAQGQGKFAGWSVVLKLGIFVLASINQLITVDAQAWAATTWTNAHATFYGGQDASGTMGGACGYGNLYANGYGIYTGALSVALFNNGLTCGACFQLMCQTDQTLYGAQYCYRGRSITITATNECPNGSFGGWCDAPKLHFDLSYPMFTSLAQEVAGVIPIQYRRVQCTKWGGVIFNLQGNSYFFLVLVTNVAGNGDVAVMSMKGDSTSSWLVMSQNWGQNWELDNHPELVAKPLSFLVSLGNGQSINFYQVMPAYWSFHSSYQSPYNFY